MGRVTYLHHYFPALYFSILLASFMIDHFLVRWTSHQQSGIRMLVWGIGFGIIILTFIYFAPISYGIYGSSNESMKGRQWRAAWDIIDDHEPDTFI